MAVALKYPVKLLKLEISGEEIEQLFTSKLKAISLPHAITADVAKAITEVTKLLATRTNKGDGNIDQRHRTAISHLEETRTIPDVTTSPHKAASRDSTYIPEQSEAYHDEQTILFTALITQKRVDDKLEASDGNLKRDGNSLTCEEMCNTLDGVTKDLLRTEIPGGSMTTVQRVGEEYRPMLDSCLIVVTKRKAVFETFKDDILDQSAYKKFVKHIKMIASFGALTVALKRLLP